MTANATLEDRLTELFSATTSGSAPIDLHAAAMTRVAGAGQRPPVLARLRGERLGHSSGAVRVTGRLVLVGAGLILLAMAAAFAAGTLRSLASGTITYVAFDGATSSIWSVRGDGTGNHRIGTGECPSVSADGASMVFVSGRDGNVKGQMIAAKGDGSEQHVLPDVEAWTGALSPDGSEVAWAKDVGVSTSATTENYVGSEDELWVSPVSGGAGVRIVPRAATPNVSYGGQAWSPTGEQIAFIAVDNATAVLGEPMEASIWIVNIDGSELHQIGSASPSTSIAWSPDGRWLTYARDTKTGPELMALAADGSVERPVGAAEPVGRSQWSPDGSYLAFVDRDGVATVEMSEGLPVGAPHRGPAVTPPTVRFDIGWSPDSRNLLIVEIRRISFGTRAENFASRLLAIDPEFEGQPTLLLDRERNIGDFNGCPITWSNR